MTIFYNCVPGAGRHGGGTFSSRLNVLPRFVFTRGAASATLDCGSGACGVQQLTSINGCWALLPPQGTANPAACNLDPLPGGVSVDGDVDGLFEAVTIGRRDFLAGLDGCAVAPCARCQLIEAHPVGAVHTVDPSGCPQGTTGLVVGNAQKCVQQTPGDDTPADPDEDAPAGPTADDEAPDGPDSGEGSSGAHP